MRHQRTLPFLAAVCLAACGAPKPLVPTPAATPRPPVQIQTQLSVNGQRHGGFTCAHGIDVAATVLNSGAEAVDLASLTVRFVSHTAGCADRSAPIDAALQVRVPAGASALARRFDAAGTLCRAGDPPQCAWTAIAEVTAGATVATDQVGLATYAPLGSGCDGITPTVLAPSDGSVVTGTANVSATVVESRACVISALTVLDGFSELGVPAFHASGLDLGDRYRWDTRTVANGRYWITPSQNCCGVPGSPVLVTVAN
jgi:hypothetical protein